MLPALKRNCILPTPTNPTTSPPPHTTHPGLVQHAVQVAAVAHVFAVDGCDDVAKHEAPILVPAGATDAALPGWPTLTSTQHKDACVCRAGWRRQQTCEDW